MSNIPEARTQLYKILHRLDSIGHHSEADDILSVIQNLMTRKSPVRRMPAKRTKITPSIRATVKRLAKTDLHLHEIGQKVGLNPGRVSEILNDKR